MASASRFRCPVDEFLIKRHDLNDLLLTRPQATFSWQVSGHSTRDAGIADGDILVVKRVSCERVFRPSLRGAPVCVLSNNDGCAIARSNEARALVSQRARPGSRSSASPWRGAGNFDLSANFTLYGDMSNRMMSIAAGPVPDQDIYSITSVVRGLRAIFQLGFNYAKTRIMLLDLQAASVEQHELDLDGPGQDRSGLMTTLDLINVRHGRGAVAPPSSGGRARR